MRTMHSFFHVYGLTESCHGTSDGGTARAVESGRGTIGGVFILVAGSVEVCNRV